LDSKGNAKALFVRNMFTQIARRYELMNKLMTAGQDRRWQRWVVNQAQLRRGEHLLDIGAGTCGIGRMALSQHGKLTVTAGDFALEMMHVGRCYSYGSQIIWCGADALNLPFRDDAFDALTSGYLMRNVNDPLAALIEQRRVLKPGGRVVCLDTSPPPRNILYPLITLHLKFGIPLLGRLVAGNSSAYQYLPQSTQSFMTPDKLANVMRLAGFANVNYRRFMFGTIAVHVGIRPDK